VDVLTVAVLVLAPSTLLQLGLRDATAPWFHTNDSAYQIERRRALARRQRLPLLGAGALLHARRYGLPGGAQPGGGAAPLRVLPGSALTAAPWRLLPAPWDDYRLLVLIAALTSGLVMLLFAAPSPCLLAASEPAMGRPPESSADAAQTAAQAPATLVRAPRGNR
jgi:hypothetical protein